MKTSEIYMKMLDSNPKCAKQMEIEARYLNHLLKLEKEDRERGL